MDCTCIYLSGPAAESIAVIAVILGALFLLFFFYTCGYHWYRRRQQTRRSGSPYRKLRGVRRAAQQKMDRRSDDFVHQVQGLRR